MDRPVKPATSRSLYRWILAVLLSVSLPVAPATIVVDGTCTLPVAILAANNDDNGSGLCPPGGSGADTLLLAGDVALAAVFDNDFGPSGLPGVTSDITVEGGNFTVERAEGAPDFRIFLVRSAGTLTLNDLTVSNASTDYSGAGIYSYFGELTLDNVTISGNHGYSGGGIFSYSGTVTVANSTISGNSAAADGGGSYHYAGTISITNSTISGNESAYSGGGFISSYATTITVTNSTLSGNSASDGGAIANYFGSISLTNTTLSGNTADTGGGLRTVLGAISVTNGTLFGNVATSGGGIYASSGSFVTLARSILVDGAGGNCGGPILDDGFNFANDASCGRGFGTITAGVDIDPTLATNGGRTRTHALLPGGVAVDAAGACGLDFDQRGYGRNVGACDSGAFELGAVACSTCAGGELLVGLLSELRFLGNCTEATCSDPGGLSPLDYLDSLAPPAPGDGYYYLE